MSKTLRYVPNFAAMGETHRRPEYIHREDCPHYTRPVEWKEASAAEMESLPRCQTCERKD
jgi:hypothetical protein